MAASNQRVSTSAPSAIQQEQVWPEGGLQGLPPTGYPDLATNPSLDVRKIMASCEQIARRHWYDKTFPADNPTRTPKKM